MQTEPLTEDFQKMRVKQVKQRVQTIVVYELLIEPENHAEEREMVVDSFDRPMQASYT